MVSYFFEHINELEFQQGWGFPWYPLSLVGKVEYVASKKAFDEIAKEHHALGPVDVFATSDDIKNLHELSPFKPFSGMCLFVAKVCEKLKFDLAFSPFEFLERRFCYDHAFACGSKQMSLAIYASRIKVTPETEPLLAHFKLRSDVIYGESTCPALLYHYYRETLYSLVKHEGKSTDTTPAFSPIALLLNAGATAGFCVFSLEAIRQGFLQKEAEAAKAEINASVTATSATTAAADTNAVEDTTTTTDEEQGKNTSNAQTKAKAKAKAKAKPASKRHLIEEDELNHFGNTQQRDAYANAVADIAEKIGKSICDSCKGEVRHLGYARSLK